MEEIDRVATTINRVVPSLSPIGRDDPTVLATKEGFVYRETGYNQIEDIINCGYVRSNMKRKSNQVWWTSGGKNSFHINKKPVLVASADKVVNEGIGAISINDLVEIWLYDEEMKNWNNKIEEIKILRNEKIEKDNKYQNEFKTMLNNSYKDNDYGKTIK